MKSREINVYKCIVNISSQDFGVYGPPKATGKGGSKAEKIDLPPEVELLILKGENAWVGWFGWWYLAQLALEGVGWWIGMARWWAEKLWWLWEYKAEQNDQVVCINATTLTTLLGAY